PGLRAKSNASAPPLRGPRAALPGPSCMFLLPGLLAAAAHQTPCLGSMGPLPLISKERHYRRMHHRIGSFTGKNRAGKVHSTLYLIINVLNFNTHVIWLHIIFPFESLLSYSQTRVWRLL